MTDLKKTPIFPLYEKYGAKTIDFGGWDLPVQFSGIKAEHEAVRTNAGLFDVSHMGEVAVHGPESLAFLQNILSNDISKLKIGKAQYNIMCYESGGVVDDLVVYMRADEDYLLVVNASNTQKDFEWLAEHAPDGVTVSNVSAEYGQLALQGPNAQDILATLTEANLTSLTFFGFVDNVEIAGVPALISRSGYTGEDGFEIYTKAADTPRVWEAILEKDVLPIGLGARDTLRFEANLALYGQELTKDISPLEAGVGFAVKLQKEPDFIGKQALIEQKEAGLTRKSVGIELIDRGIPRHDYKVFAGNQEIGVVTSGTQSPTLGKNLGLALIDIAFTALDTEVEVEVRNKKLKAKVVQTPFYKRVK